MAKRFDYVAIGAAIAAVAVAAWMLFILGTPPEPLQAVLDSVNETISPTAVGVLVAGVLLLVVALRSVRGTPAILDRSLILNEPPEHVSESPVPSSALVHENVFKHALDEFDTVSNHERRVVIYGYRAMHSANIPKSVKTVFDELGITARDTYATATGCSVDEAAAAIRSGEWTDDRVAAAFLAADVDADPEFTIKERLIAWLSPKHVFRKRLERTVQAIEAVGDTYLTYTPPAADRSGSTEQPTSAERWT
jgi:hypothetical protein